MAIKTSLLNNYIKSYSRNTIPTVCNSVTYHQSPKPIMISINTYHLACAEGSALQCYSFDYSKSMLFEQNFISSQTPLYYRIFDIRRMHNPMTANPITDVLIKDMSMFMPNPPSFLDWAVSATNDHLAASADCLIF